MKNAKENSYSVTGPQFMSSSVYGVLGLQRFMVKSPSTVNFYKNILFHQSDVRR